MYSSQGHQTGLASRGSRRTSANLEFSLCLFLFGTHALITYLEDYRSSDMSVSASNNSIFSVILFEGRVLLLYSIRRVKC